MTNSLVEKVGSFIELSKDPNYAALFHIKGKKYFVTNHALNEFLKEVPKIKKLKNLNLKNPEKVIRVMFDQFKTSIKVERKNSLMQILRNDFKPADYFFNNRILYVVENECVLITCYQKDCPNENYYTIPKEVVHP